MQMLHAVMTHPQLLVSRGRFLSHFMQGVRTQSVNSIRREARQIECSRKAPGPARACWVRRRRKSP